MVHPHNEAPVNPLPPVVVALFVMLAGIELAFSLGARGIVGGPEAVGWRLAAQQRYGFSGEVFDWMLATGQYPVEHVLRLFSYPFVHVSFTHALFSIVIFLAMGKIAAEAMGAFAMLVVFVLSGVGGAVAYAMLLDDPVWLLGAYPPVYGLIGAFTYLLWMRLGQLGAQQVRAFSLIGVLLLIQLIFSLLFGGGNDWLADVVGFALGFALTILLVPGGWQRLRDRLRRQ